MEEDRSDLHASGLLDDVIVHDLGHILGFGTLWNAASNEFLARYLDVPGHPLKAWLVFEVLGVFTGALLSGVLAGRMSRTVEKGPRASVALRLGLAFLGGFLMAFGAAMGRGCNSGQALSGGALLNAGSWIFMLCFFGGAYGVAWFVRRQWR